MSNPNSSACGGRNQRILVLHPLLLAVFPILSLLAHNRHEVHLAWATVPVLVSMGLTMMLWGLFAIVLRDWVKAAIPASLGILTFFGFGHLVRPWIPESLGPLEVAAPVFIGQAVLLLGVCSLLRRRGRPVRFTQFANLAAALTLALPAMPLLGHSLVGGRPRFDAAAVTSSGVTGGAARPDIYLIIPDAHARGDVLRDVYGYDVEPFLSELESLGFAVARQSTANYSMTPLSIASLLNFSYLPEHEELAWGDLAQFTDLISRSTTESMLDAHGYKTVAFPSAAAYTEMTHFDVYYRGLGAALGFYRMVADLTPLATLLEDHPSWNGLLSDRDRILRTLEDLPAVARDPDPTFAFVHLSLPHPPFQFGENGEDVYQEYRGLDDDGIGSRSPDAQDLYPEAYRRQTIYTNRRLLEVVREILAESASPPVIMIVSDHGPRLNFHWRDAQVTDSREALGNLTAIYLPNGRAAELIYPTITPVNVMRVALNEVLGTELELLEDRAFLSTNVDEVHHLVDVTWQIRDRERGLPSAEGVRARRDEVAPDAPAMQQEQQDQWLAPLYRSTLSPGSHQDRHLRD